MPTEITLPHQFSPRNYQLPFFRAMDGGVKRAVLVWHRRSGKDKAMINFMAKEMPRRKGTYHYVFPEYNQGRKVIWDGMDRDGFPFMEHFPKELIRDKNNTEMKLTLKTGSIFQVVGSDKMDNIVGTNPLGVVFSEFPLQKPTAWDYYRPILAENAGWAVFGYTPRGMNHGWKLLQQARSEPNWFSQLLTVDDTRVISPDVLEEEKRQMPEALYKQEYYCEFLEGAGAFFRRVAENQWDADALTHEGHVFQIGADLAKYQDWTVITPFCLTCFKALQQDRFNQVDWNLQKSRIEAVYHRHKATRAIVDSTGVGDPIVEDLERMGLTVEPYKFTEISRRQLLDNLALLLEQDRIKIPRDEGLADELRSFSYTLTEQGKLKVGVPEGMHDDRVFSLALSVWSASSPLPAAEQEVALYGGSYS